MRAKILRVAILTVSLCLTASVATPAPPPAATTPASKPRIESYPIKVQVASEWIVGIPLWALVTLQNDRDKETKGPLSSLQVFSMIPGCDYTLSDPVTHDVISSERRQEGNSGPMNRGPVEYSTLPPHTEMTFVVRLHSPPPKTPSGKYLLTFNYPWAGFTGSCAVQLRAPTEQEAPFLKDPDALWKYPFTRSAPAPAADMPPTLKDAFAMDRLCHDLFISFTSRDDLQKHDPAKLGADLPVFYRPIVDCFRCEILLAQKKTVQEEELERAVLKDYPGLKWVFQRMQDERFPQGLISLGRGGVR
jgi:hypothetical protein